MSEGLFRKASIDKVSSPEQLDLLMRVTSPVGWLALLTVGMMLTAVGVWSVLGSIPDLVDGSGTLFRGERIYDIKATMGGSIVTLDVRPGSFVVAGQTDRQAETRSRRASRWLRPPARGRWRLRGKSKRRKSRSNRFPIGSTANQSTIKKNQAVAERLRGQKETMQRQWQAAEAARGPGHQGGEGPAQPRARDGRRSGQYRFAARRGRTSWRRPRSRFRRIGSWPRQGSPQPGPASCRPRQG